MFYIVLNLDVVQGYLLKRDTKGYKGRPNFRLKKCNLTEGKKGGQDKGWPSMKGCVSIEHLVVLLTEAVDPLGQHSRWVCTTEAAACSSEMSGRDARHNPQPVPSNRFFARVMY
jgi:hypothetical protein